MSLAERVLGWLVREWPPAVLLVAGFLLALLPLWWSVAGLIPTLVLAQLVIYLVHQGEEHIGDRFRRYINQHIAGGREALTPVATFWINALGVWALDLIALYLAMAVAPAYGLIAAYMCLVNAAAHIAGAVRLRAYNPGLITAVVLFVPLGVWAAVAIDAGWPYHLLGLGVALASHAAIVVHVARRFATQARAHA